MDSSQFDNDPSVFKINCRNRAGEIIGFGIVDIDDAVEVSKHSWSMTNGYLTTYVKVDNCRKPCMLHHFLIGKPPTGMVTDHISHNKNDNRRSNLRFVSYSQNSQNRTKKPNSSSKFYGVFHSRRKKPWMAKCGKKSIGYFKTEQEAAWAYDSYVLSLFPNPQINGVNKPEICEDYVPREKKMHSGMVLPCGISLLPNGHFRVQLIKPNKTYHDKRYKTLTEALTAHKMLFAKIDEERSKIIQDEMKKPICKNESGIAFLRFKNTDVLIDDDVYLEVINRARYLDGQYPTIFIEGKKIALHQWLMQPTPENHVVDHRDRNPLNAQRSNLRYVTHSENAQNRSKVKNASSCYFGVSAIREGFEVQVQKDGKRHYGGYYKNEQIAAFAADQLSLMLFRDKARSNGINLPGYIFKNNRAVKIEDVDFGESDSIECLYKRQKT